MCSSPRSSGIPFIARSASNRLLRPALIFFFKQKTAYEITVRDWSSDVCSSDLSDVLLVGSADLTVGVRVGPRGVLGEASGAAVAGGARPEPGLLSFALVDRGAATVGDVVTTLGSVGDRPFVPGIPVGAVATV